jgi:anti-anti-sigma factor
MAFSAELEMIDGIAKIALSGELDASSAPIFQKEIEKVELTGLKHLVLLMQDLEYMASAGLRVLIFAKQKMGTNVDIYIISPQETVLDTLVKTGYDQSVIIQDQYP